MSDYTIVFVHGINGSTHWNFFPRVTRRLRSHHISFLAPSMPGGMFNSFPMADQWIETIRQVVDRIETPIVFVGYSLGVRAILLYLEKYQTQVTHVFCIASPANNTKMQGVRQGRAKSFFTQQIDLASLRPLSHGWTVIHSRDDTIADFSWGESIAKELAAEFIALDGYGHFSKRKHGDTIFHILQEKLSIV